MKVSSKNLKTAIILFFMFSSLYIITTPAFINTPDGVIMAKLANSFLSFRLDVEPIAQRKDFGGKTITDHKTGVSRLYPWFAPGTSLISVPAAIAAKALYPLTGEGDRRLLLNSGVKISIPDEDGKPKTMLLNTPYYPNHQERDFKQCWDFYIISWTNSFITAGILTAMFLITLLMGFGRVSAIMFTTVCGLTTPLWHYAGEFFSEPLAAAAIIWSIYFLMRGRTSRTLLNYSIAGALFGLSFLTKAAHIILLIPYAVIVLTDLSGNIKDKLKPVAGFGIASLSIGLLYPLYNFFRFGNPFDTGYGKHVAYWTTPFSKGAWGLLFSNGRGLFIYVPMVILTMAGLGFALKKSRSTTIFGLLSITVFVAFYAKWYMWEGGWCWGPRFLMPVLPVLLLPAVYLFDNTPRSFLMKLIKIFTISAGFVISISGVIVNYADYSKYLMLKYLAFHKAFLKEGIEDYYDLLLWDPVYSPVTAHWSFPFKNRLLLTRVFEEPGLVSVIFIFLFLILVVSIFWLLKNRSDSEV